MAGSPESWAEIALSFPQIRLDNSLTSGALEDLAGFLKGLMQKGKIAAPVYYGGDADRDVLVQGLEKKLLDAVAAPLGPLNPAAARDILPLAEKSGAGFMALVPFQKGLFFDCGREAGLSDRDAARAAWGMLRNHHGLSTALFGVSGPREVRDNLTALASAGPPDSEILARFFNTRTYERFISEMKQHAPHLAVDQRS